jgi:hypothetical protein
MALAAAIRGRRRPWERIPESRRLPLGVYAAAQLILFAWWLAFVPGLTSYDSVAYVWQATTGNWMTNHSVLYTALVWLSLRAGGSLAPLSLAQTVALAAGLAYAVAGLRGLGVPGRALAAAAIAVPLLPPIGSFTVFIWKDVPFVIVQVFLLGTLARLVAVRRTPGPRRWYADRRLVGLFAALLVEYTLMGLFRQNGFLIVLVAAAVTAAFLAGIRTILLAIGAAATVLTLVMNLWIYPALGTEPAKSDLVLGPAYADIAVAYADRPDEFTTEDKAVMARVAPLEFWARSANCYTSDTTTGQRQFDRSAAADNAGELFALWVRLVARMPDEIIDARLCRGSIAWKIGAGPERIGTVLTPLEGSRRLFGFGSRMDGNPYTSAIYLDPPLGGLHDAAAWLRRASDAQTLKPIMWRGATWCYVGYAAILVFARRRRGWAAVSLAAVSLSNQFVVLIDNPSQLVRYMLGPLVVGILLVPLLFAQSLGRGAGAAPAGAKEAGALGEPTDAAAAFRLAEGSPAARRGGRAAAVGPAGSDLPPGNGHTAGRRGVPGDGGPPAERAPVRPGPAGPETSEPAGLGPAEPAGLGPAEPAGPETSEPAGPGPAEPAD